MEIKNKKQILSVFLSVLVSVFLVSFAVYAVTTIGANIDTAGNLVVDGNATSSGNFIIGTSSWDAPTSTLTVVGTAYFNDNATTSSSLWIGAAGTANSIDLGGGDLYVEDDAEIDGDLFVAGNASSTSAIVRGWATTTDLWVGAKQSADATTTAVFGDDITTNSAVCLKIMAADDSWVYAYATSSQSTAAMGLNWTQTSCE